MLADFIPIENVSWPTAVLIITGLGWAGWVSISIIKLYMRVAGLAKMYLGQAQTCKERLEWMRKQDDTLGTLTGGQGEIKGMLSVLMKGHNLKEPDEPQ